MACWCTSPVQALVLVLVLVVVVVVVVVVLVLVLVLVIVLVLVLGTANKHSKQTENAQKKNKTHLSRQLVGYRSSPMSRVDLGEGGA